MEIDKHFDSTSRDHLLCHNMKQRSSPLSHQQSRLTSPGTISFHQGISTVKFITFNMIIGFCQLQSRQNSNASTNPLHTLESLTDCLSHLIPADFEADLSQSSDRMPVWIQEPKRGGRRKGKLLCYLLER